MSALTPQSDMPTPTTDKITQAAMETIYLCKFRVSMDGEWLCLRELDDISLTPDPEPTHEGTAASLRGRASPGRCSSCPESQEATLVLHVAPGMCCICCNARFEKGRLCFIAFCFVCF